MLLLWAAAVYSYARVSSFVLCFRGSQFLYTCVLSQNKAAAVQACPGCMVACDSYAVLRVVLGVLHSQ